MPIKRCVTVLMEPEEIATVDALAARFDLARADIIREALRQLVEDMKDAETLPLTRKKRLYTRKGPQMPGTKKGA